MKPFILEKLSEFKFPTRRTESWTADGQTNRKSCQLRRHTFWHAISMINDSISARNTLVVKDLNAMNKPCKLVSHLRPNSPMMCNAEKRELNWPAPGHAWKYYLPSRPSQSSRESGYLSWKCCMSINTYIPPNTHTHTHTHTHTYTRTHTHRRRTTQSAPKASTRHSWLVTLASPSLAPHPSLSPLGSPLRSLFQTRTTECAGQSSELIWSMWPQCRGNYVSDGKPRCGAGCITMT